MKLYISTGQEPPFGLPGTRRRHFSETQKTKVYDAIFSAGKDGLTRNDVATRVGLAADRISFYLSELKRAGYITSKGDPTTVDVNMGAEEAAMAALLGLENALVARVRETLKSGAAPSPDMDRAFVKYQKIKELALRPGTGAEGKVALRMAVLELVKLVF